MMMLDVDVSRACVDRAGHAADARGVGGGGHRATGRCRLIQRLLFGLDALLQCLDLSLRAPFLLDQVERNGGFHHKFGLALLDQQQVFPLRGQLATEGLEQCSTVVHFSAPIESNVSV